MSKEFSFGASPTVRMRRSRFDLSHSLKTSMSVGTLYPIDVTEVLPGDTFKMHTTQVCRLTSAFLRPVMDNCFMDVYYFFVPNRLVYDKWKETFGENTKSAWANNDRPDVPTLVNGIVESKTVGDYLGLPVGNVPSGINVLPFRAFALIYDQWFRNENTVDPMLVQKGELAAAEAFNNNPWSPSNYLGKLPKVGKKKDYFTSCLPSPQKGEAVPISVMQDVPVFAKDERIDETLSRSHVPTGWITGLTLDDSHAVNLVARSNGKTNPLGVPEGTVSTATSEVGLQAPSYFYFNNLWAGTSQLAAANVNDLRLAAQLQKMFEKDARYGTRYREFILGHFGVSNPDYRMQIPEFLGGKRMPINVQQVAQTNTQQKSTEQTIESPLASLGAMSQTVGQSRFTKSFTEHGFVITVACIRQMHTYQQGINRMWQRKKREDYYDPLFANLGEQPVYQSEIYAAADELQGDVFGYNEAWADYRYKPSQITGEMRSNITNSLDVWHFGDDYANAPVLGQEFTDETPTFFDRTVAVPSTSQDNFIVDFWFDFKAFRVMPTYSVPGLIDHH